MYFHLQKWTYFLLKNAKFKGIKSSQVKLRGSFATSEGPIPPPSSPSSSQTGWQWRWLYIVDLVDDDGNLWHGCNKKRSQNLRIAKMHFLTLKQLSGRFMFFLLWILWRGGGGGISDPTYPFLGHQQNFGSADSCKPSPISEIKPKLELGKSNLLQNRNLEKVHLPKIRGWCQGRGSLGSFYCSLPSHKLQIQIQIQLQMNKI